ncbi:MAG TPA: HD domain-containing phosphohydrolase [Gemmatimonadaceae bacterium]|jgi:putative nucleotidyltransferase with HDIG domain
MKITPRSLDALTSTEDALEEAQRLERAGQRSAARRIYEMVVFRARRSDAVGTATILRRIARTFIDDHELESALDCYAAALAVAECNNDLGAIAHSMNGMAGIHLLRGNLDESKSMSAKAREYAKQVGDDALSAMISQNLGIIASMRGDLDEALQNHTMSLETYRAAGMQEYVGPVLNNMGLTLTNLDRLDEAQAAYDEALAHCTAIGDTPNQLLALINSTSLWLAKGDIDRAEHLCKTVIAEATSFGDQRSLAEAYKHLGVIAHMRGDLVEGERQLAVAYDDAIRREDLLLAAETAREQALLYETMDKSRDVLKALSQSHRLFTKLRAQRDLADLQRRTGRLERQFYDVVTRWAQTIEEKDAYTHGHCERVADYACALARDVGFDDITMFWFRIGALLHDVGKIVVPLEVLNKPGRFTPEERAIMERHAPAGAELLADIDFPWDILPMVRGHHEKWDGTGYPDKLAGENIDITARITCIADVFDALTTDRPYRPGFTVDEALAMMTKDVGKMFDPDLFPRFVRIMRDTQLFKRSAAARAASTFAAAS